MAGAALPGADFFFGTPEDRRREQHEDSAVRLYAALRDDYLRRRDTLSPDAPLGGKAARAVRLFVAHERELIRRGRLERPGGEFYAWRLRELAESALDLPLWRAQGLWRLLEETPPPVRRRQRNDVATLLIDFDRGGATTLDLAKILVAHGKAPRLPRLPRDTPPQLVAAVAILGAIGRIKLERHRLEGRGTVRSHPLSLAEQGALRVLDRRDVVMLAKVSISTVKRALEGAPLADSSLWRIRRLLGKKP